MDLYFPARSGDEGSDSFFKDKELMRFLWSPIRMPISYSPPPPSPPAPAGFVLWDSDDDRVSSWQTALIPAQADAAEAEVVTVPGNADGDNTDAPRKPEHVSSNWYLDASLQDGSTDGLLLLKERLTHTLRCLKGYTDSWMLVQVFVKLVQFGVRLYSTDSSNLRGFGSPGRVSRSIHHKYPLVRHEINCTVRVTAAFPAEFYTHMKSCVAVSQLAMKSKKMDNRSEYDLMCKELEALDLIMTSLPSCPIAQVSVPIKKDDGKQKALVESVSIPMKHNLSSLKIFTHGDFGSPQFSDMPVIGTGVMKEIDSQDTEIRHCESALVLDRSKRMRSNTDNAEASTSVVQHHPCTQPINAPGSKYKSRSKVWNHFTKMDGKRAICKHCKKDYAADPKIHGTSRLLRHLKHDHEIDLKASSSESGK